MRVLHINNYHHIRGGSDSVYFSTCNLLDGAGHHNVYFAAAHTDNYPCSQDKYFPRAVDTASAGIRHLGRFLHNPAARKRLRAVIDAQGPFDVAHLHIYYGRLTPSILKPLRDAGIPIVQTLHEYKLACPVYTLERDGQTCEACVSGSTLNVLRHRCKANSLPKSMAMFAEFWASRAQGDVRLIDRFICVSEFQAEIMSRAGVPEHKLRQLHNFVDVSRIRPSERKERGDYLLYFGRVEKLKGLPTLISAIGKTRHKLKVAGDGAWVNELKLAAHKNKNIEYVGFASGSELYALIANAEAVVVPSEWYENCPLAILEAKASGTPVVGANIGGIPELIREGRDGFLFDPGNVASLCNALNRLSESDKFAMAQAARRDVERRFSPDAYLQQLLRIYDEVRI